MMCVCIRHSHTEVTGAHGVASPLRLGAQHGRRARAANVQNRRRGGSCRILWWLGRERCMIQQASPRAHFWCQGTIPPVLSPLHINAPAICYLSFKKVRRVSPPSELARTVTVKQVQQLFTLTALMPWCSSERRLVGEWVERLKGGLAQLDVLDASLP